jgi:O-antigen/teichoic acid export membrane protein
MSETRSSGVEARWSVLDQAFVSGGNFATALVLARTLPPAEYGTFSLLYLSLFAINTVPASLIVYPLTLRGALADGAELSTLTGTAMIQTSVLALLLAPVLLLTSFFLHRPDVWPALALAMIMWQLQESARRALLSARRTRSAVLPDALCYLGQAALILLLHTRSLNTVFLLMAATSAVATCWQLLLLRPAWSFSRALADCVYCWTLGRFILAGNVLNMIALQVPSWTLNLTSGRAVVGSYQSLLNLVGVANPIIFSANNLLIPEIARGAQQGVRAARRMMVHHGVRYGALLLPAFAVLLFAPHWAMALVYGARSPYLALAYILPYLAAAYLVQYLVTVAGAYEGGMSRPKSYLWIQITGTIILLAAGIPLIYRSGPFGAALALLAAAVVRLITCGVLSWRADRHLVTGAGSL